MAQVSSSSFFNSEKILKTDNEGNNENIIHLQEVSLHDNVYDCWIVIYDKVYDITEFLDEHPGGYDILMEYAGRDATFAFRSSGHSKFAIDSLNQFLIGQLPVHERLFRKPGAYILTDIPN